MAGIVTKSVQQFQNVVLEMIARGDALIDTADQLCILVEELVSGVTCSILRVDLAGKLRPLSSPSLPESYSACLDGLIIGEDVGSCGAAAFLGAPVVVEDIATDPKWTLFKELALPLGLKACWSTPVYGLSGKVIGTFAFYFDTARGPTAHERTVVAACVHLCSIALDRHDRVIDRERKAYFDTLTDLENRASFVRALSELECDRSIRWGLILLDVDNLKIVNDTFGHHAGDELLRTVAARFPKSISPHVVYRLGGDEFAAIIKGEVVDNIDEISERVLRDLAVSANCAGHSVFPSATIGSAVVADAEECADAVRRNADFALYHAKENFRGGYVRHSPQLSSTMLKRANAIRDVTIALDELRIDAYYQPIVRLDDRKIVGVEALCRLIKSDGEVLPASSFYEATSDARVAGEITRRMMAVAAADVRNWLELGIPFQHVGINLSSADFHGGRLDEKLAAFANERVPLRHLAIEVTESVYMRRHDQNAAKVLELLRSRGVVVALDDFGTGFASLTDLLTLPIDILKIDKTFVDRLADGEVSVAIIEALVSIAKKLGMRVIAEGVENENQARQLSDIGCVLAQGYLFSRPVHRSEATALLLRSAQPLADILRVPHKTQALRQAVL